MICKHILLIKFLNEPESIFNILKRLKVFTIKHFLYTNSLMFNLLQSIYQTVLIYINYVKSNSHNQKTVICLESNVKIVLFQTIKFSLSNIKQFVGGGPRGVMIKVTDSGIVVTEFVLQTHYYVRFRANTRGKGMKPLILPAMG